MANIPSARKRARQTIKRTQRNNAVKSHVRYHIRNFTDALGESDVDNIKKALHDAIKVIDKAAAKGVIHKNAAARKKSSLYKRLAEADISVS